MLTTTARKPWAFVLMAALSLILASSTTASAARSLFFEETAEALWVVPHTCADGSTVQATLLVRTTRDFESPDTEDADPLQECSISPFAPTERRLAGPASFRRPSRAPTTSRVLPPPEQGSPETIAGARTRSRSRSPGRPWDRW